MSRPLSRLLARHLAGTKFDKGTVKHVEVLHQDDCGIWHDRLCDCEPKVVSGPAIDRKYLP
jgi:hypothetical protein